MCGPKQWSWSKARRAEKSRQALPKPYESWQLIRFVQSIQYPDWGRRVAGHPLPKPGIGDRHLVFGTTRLAARARTCLASSSEDTDRSSGARESPECP